MAQQLDQSDCTHGGTGFTAIDLCTRPTSHLLWQIDELP